MHIPSALLSAILAKEPFLWSMDDALKWLHVYSYVRIGALIQHISGRCLLCQGSPYPLIYLGELTIDLARLAPEVSNGPFT